MIKDCIFETWNYKYNQYTPCKIIEKVDSKFVRIHGYAWKENRDTGEHEVVAEYTTMTYLQSLRNIGTKELDLLSMFREGSFLRTRGFDIIVDLARSDCNGNIYLYFKYLQCSEERGKEIRDKFPPWSWINNYNAQFKKINPGPPNCIAISPEDKVEFIDPFIPERLQDHRKEWCFEDPVNRETIVFLERLIGYVREDGKTWMEYFWDSTDGQGIGVRIKDQSLVCIDAHDPKNPIQICTCEKVEDMIEESVKYIKNERNKS